MMGKRLKKVRSPSGHCAIGMLRMLSGEGGLLLHGGYKL
jgi:hypothetical protein